MTGYTVHTGSTEKFASGWDQIFKASSGKPAAGKKAAAKKAAKKTGKTKAAKKK